MLNTRQTPEASKFAFLLMWSQSLRNVLPAPNSKPQDDCDRALEWARYYIKIINLKQNE